MSSKSDHSNTFKSAQSNSNASFESLYSIDDEESNTSNHNNNVGTGAGVTRIQSPNSLFSSLSTEGSQSPSKHAANASTAATSNKTNATLVSSEPKQKRHPPPPSSPYNPTYSNSTSSGRNNNLNNRCAPPIPKTAATQLDPQARLRANASSACPSVVQKRQSRCNNTSTSNRKPASFSSTSSAAFSVGTNQFSSNLSQQQQLRNNHHYVHSGSRASTPPSSNVSYHSNNNITNSMPLHTNNTSLNNISSSITNNNNSNNEQRDDTTMEPIKGEWKIVDVNTFTENGNTPSSPPCERSLHAAALWNDQFLIFGGYDGQTRRNDFYSFHLKEHKWNLILGNGGTIPSPRDRHCAIAYSNSFYIFGGFDGTSRVNDFYEFDFTTMMWNEIISSGHSAPPSPRHSHSVVVHMDSMFVFGGYDGSYRSDFYEYNFLSNTWSHIPPVGRSPRARYRATSVTYKNKMILYGGHDGTRHLSDLHMFDFRTRTWSMIVDVLGSPPLARDSHICSVHGDSMFIFGGSAGTAMNDMYELRLNDGKEEEEEGGEGNDIVLTWKPVIASGSVSHRFCHVGAIYGGSFYVFGGYDGNSRLNDFMRFDFNFDDLSYNIPSSTLVMDMRLFVNNEMLSDVVFIVEGQQIHAHKLMLVRCNYFRAMLTGSMMESNLSTIHLEEVRYPIFLSILEYLYTDKLDIQVESAMELFAAADLFDIPRLQSMCEKELLQSINTENAATIFHAADEHSATMLRSKSLNFILKHFEDVSKSQAFEEMARHNVELVVEILRLR